MNGKEKEEKRAAIAHLLENICRPKFGECRDMLGDGPLPGRIPGEAANAYKARICDMVRGIAIQQLAKLLSQ